MAKLVILLSLLGILALFTACDERKGIKPVMDIAIENIYLYNDGAACNLNHTQITFTLEGTTGFISEAKIFVDYDHSKGLFVGTGSSEFIITNENGVAVGTFVADESALGLTTFSAWMEVFPSVRQEKVIYILVLPAIEYFTAVQESLQVGSSTEIAVKLTDLSDQVADMTIEFTATTGIFEFEEVQTDENGIAQNIYYAGEETGTAVITATLAICPNVTDSLTITIE